MNNHGRFYEEQKKRQSTWRPAGHVEMLFSNGRRRRKELLNERRKENKKCWE
jgi:hypothetical protein